MTRLSRDLTLGPLCRLCGSNNGRRGLDPCLRRGPSWRRVDSRLHLRTWRRVWPNHKRDNANNGRNDRDCNQREYPLPRSPQLLNMFDSIDLMHAMRTQPRIKMHWGKAVLAMFDGRHPSGPMHSGPEKSSAERYYHARIRVDRPEKSSRKKHR